MKKTFAYALIPLAFLLLFWFLWSLLAFFIGDNGFYFFTWTIFVFGITLLGTLLFYIMEIGIILFSRYQQYNKVNEVIFEKSEVGTILSMLVGMITSFGFLYFIYYFYTHFKFWLCTRFYQSVVQLLFQKLVLILRFWKNFASSY